MVIAEEIHNELRNLEFLMSDLGLPRKLSLSLGAALGERLGRLKLNGRVTEASPLTPVVESEFMRSAVLGKIGLWRTLRDLSPYLGLEPANFENLEAQAEAQLAVFNDLHAISTVNGFLRDETVSLHKD